MHTCVYVRQTHLREATHSWRSVLGSLLPLQIIIVENSAENCVAIMSDLHSWLQGNSFTATAFDLCEQLLNYQFLTLCLWFDLCWFFCVRVMVWSSRFSRWKDGRFGWRHFPFQLEVEFGHVPEFIWKCALRKHSHVCQLRWGWLPLMSTHFVQCSAACLQRGCLKWPWALAEVCATHAQVCTCMSVHRLEHACAWLIAICVRMLARLVFLWLMFRMHAHTWTVISVTVKLCWCMHAKQQVFASRASTMSAWP